MFYRLQNVYILEHLILLFLYVSGQKSATDVTKKLPEDITPLRVVETYSPRLGRCGCNSSSVNLLLTLYEAG